MINRFTGNQENDPSRIRYFRAWKYFMRDGEDGAIIVLVAVAMTVLLGVTALCIDAGMAYLRTNQLQTSLDAAVYSACQKLPVMITDTDSQNAVKDLAIHYAALNGYPELSRNDVTLEGEALGYYTKIRVSASESMNLKFAPALGIDTVNFTRSSAAKLSPLKKISGLAPLGVEESVLQTKLADHQLEHVVLKYGISSGAGPFFGALDFDGLGGGASDYRLWLSTGYNGEVHIGDILYKEDGNMTGPTYQGFSDLYNACTHYGALTGWDGCTADHYNPSCPRIVKIVVYTTVDKQTIQVEGFAAFLLEQQTDDGYITGTFLSETSNGECSGEDMTDQNFYALSGVMLA